ncbi:MAG: hypothetical protein AAF950_17775 [Pseudomonadota bacterium]
MEYLIGGLAVLGGLAIIRFAARAFLYIKCTRDVAKLAAAGCSDATIEDGVNFIAEEFGQPPATVALRVRQHMQTL